MKAIQSKYIMYAIGILVLLVIAYQISGAFADGIRKLFGITDEPEINLSEVTIDQPNLTEPEHATAKRLAVAAHEDMSGVGWNRNMDLWREIVGLPDEVLVATYNYFNAMYFSEREGTMYTWLMDEWGWQDPFQGTASREQVAGRMAALNLL